MITYQTVSSGSTGVSSASSLTVAHTIPNSGEDNYTVYALLSWGGSGTSVSSITYDGFAMTLVTSETTNANVCTAVYSYTSPTIAVSKNIVVNWGGSTNCVLGVISVSGSLIATPIHMSGTNVATAALSISKALTTTIHQTLLIDVVAYSQSFAIAVNAPQVSRYNLSFANSAKFAGASTRAVSTSDVFTSGWNQGSFTGDWSYIVIALNPDTNQPGKITINKLRPRAFAPGFAR